MFQGSDIDCAMVAKCGYSYTKCTAVCIQQTQDVSRGWANAGPAS